MTDTEAPNSRGGVRRPRVLIVDDEPALLRGLSRLLAQMNPSWEILAANTASQAIAHLQAGFVDVLVTDLQMPQMDGFTLLTIAKERFPRTVRVVHSSQTGTIETDRLLDLAHRILTKPARPADISDVLNWALTSTRRAGNGEG